MAGRASFPKETVRFSVNFLIRIVERRPFVDRKGEHRF